MNTPANPAVTSSDAGIRPSSSRFLALIAGAPMSVSLRDPSLRERHHQRTRVRLRPKMVVQQRAPPIRGDQRSRNARRVERLIQADPSREVVRKPAVDRDDALLVGADEVKL